MRLFKKKEELLDPYTIEQCNSCNKTSKRKFTEGDHVFKTTGTCTSCNAGQIVIQKIFGEVIK